MLVHKREYLDWQRGKKARGQMIAALPAHIRYIHTEALRGQRNLIRKRLGQDHNTAYHRFMIFDQLKHLSYERIILKKGCSDPTSRKERMRRGLQSARQLRLNAGNPLAFSDYRRPFWADVNSNYMPEDDVQIAEKTIKFYRVSLVHHSGKITSAVSRRETKRPHAGLWGYIELDDRFDDSDLARFHFYFESAADLIDFRMRYEIEMTLIDG